MKAYAPSPNQSCFLEPIAAEGNYHKFEVDTVNPEMDTVLDADNHMPWVEQDEDHEDPTENELQALEDDRPVGCNRWRGLMVSQAIQQKEEKILVNC